LVIFHLFAQQPLCKGICTKFGIGVEVADVITCDEIFGDRLRGSNLWVLKYDWFPFDEASCLC